MEEGKSYWIEVEELKKDNEKVYKVLSEFMNEYENDKKNKEDKER